MFRPSLLALAAVAAAFALYASPASATVTSSDVTSPTDGAVIFGEVHSSDTLTVSGTSDGTTGDQVRIDCFSGTGASAFTVLMRNVSVDVDGNFTTDIPKGYLIGVANPCVLRATPESPTPSPAPPGSSSPYSGPTIIPEGTEDDSISGGDNDGLLYDYYLQDVQSQGSYDYRSAGDCGVYDSYLWDPVTFGVIDELFYCNDGLSAFDGEVTPSSPDQAQATGSELRVDGTDAFLPGALYGPSAFETGFDPRQLPGFPELSWTHSYDSGNAVTITESEQPVSCAPDPTVFPPTPASCTSWVPTGLRLDRTITQSHDGLVATIRDKWTSVDGGAHRLGLELENAQNSNSTSKVVGYEFPWISSSFAAVHVGTLAPPPSGPGRVYVTSDLSAPSGSTTTPRGAIVFAGPPKDERVAYAQDSSSQGSTVLFEYDRTIPAGGSTSLAFSYADAFNQADVAAMADSAQAAFTPSISMNPLPASTAASSVTVTGKASFAEGLAGVSVNGVAAALAGDGSWSATVPVHPGANTITATATTIYGGSAQASGSITGPTPAVTVTAPKLHLGRAKVSGKYVVFRASCVAAAGASCQGKAALSFKEKLRGKRIVSFTAKKRKKKPKLRTKTLHAGSKSFKVAAGKPATVKVLLSRSAQKLLKHYRKLTVRLTVNLTGSAKTAKVGSQKVTFKVKTKKKHHHR